MCKLVSIYLTKHGWDKWQTSNRSYSRTGILPQKYPLRGVRFLLTTYYFTCLCSFPGKCNFLGLGILDGRIFAWRVRSPDFDSSTPKPPKQQQHNKQNQQMPALIHPFLEFSSRLTFLALLGFSWASHSAPPSLTPRVSVVTVKVNSHWDYCQALISSQTSYINNWLATSKFWGMTIP